MLARVAMLCIHPREENQLVVSTPFNIAIRLLDHVREKFAGLEIYELDFIGLVANEIDTIGEDAMARGDGYCANVAVLLVLRDLVHIENNFLSATKLSPAMDTIRLALLRSRVVLIFVTVAIWRARVRFLHVRQEFGV